MGNTAVDVASPAGQAGTDDTAEHVWVGAATVELDLKQAKRAVLRGSIRVPETTRLDVLECYCRECRRPYEDVADEPCVAATFTEHLRGGPIGTRKKRRHDLPRCDLLGCNVPSAVEQPDGEALTGLVRVQCFCRASDPRQNQGCSVGVWRLTAEQEAEAARLYAAGLHQRQIGLRFGVHQMTILRSLRRQGVAIRGYREAHTRCTLWHDALDRLTPDAAYWCGFLFADGSVTARPAGQGDLVQVKLSECDHGHLVKLRGFLGSTHAITPSPARVCGVYRDGRAYMGRPTCTFAVASQPLADRLRSLGRYEGPVSPELAVSRDFWRGTVDGDGSFGLYPDPYKPAPAVYARVELVGTSRLLDAFLAFLASHGLAGDMSVRPRKGENVHVVATTGRLAGPIVDLLYRDAAVALDRKALRAATIIAGCPA